MVIAIVTYMGCIVTVLQQCRLQMMMKGDSSRRLTESRPQIPLRPWLDPPTPLNTGKSWNATTIRWVGNSFYFPNHNGVDKGSSISSSFQQLYTPHQIQRAFRHHSILLQGDSTVRRLYGSLHGILSLDVWTGSTSMDFPNGFPAQVPHPPFGVPATYFVRRGLEYQAKGTMNPTRLLSLLMHSPAPIDPRLLEHRTILDVNKDFYTEPCARVFPSSYIMHTPAFGLQKSDDIDNLDGSKKDVKLSITFKSSQFEYKVCRPHPTGGWLPPVPMPKQTPNSQQQGHPMPSPLLYDYINNNCLGHIHDFVTHELSYQQSITRKYSIYIAGLGVWETVKKAQCHHPLYERFQSSNEHHTKLQWPNTIYQLLQETLEKLAMLAEQSPELLIIWRTSGYYDGDAESRIIKEMNRRAIIYVHDWNDKHRRLRKRSKRNFLIMDFGSAVEHRSHGKTRLRGDMQAHYGLEVRVLQVQMLTNLLYEHGYVK
ncbi:hypothetical protein ACHAXR_007575 [Thalassiosira sp. AJA248-18]